MKNILRTKIENFVEETKFGYFGPSEKGEVLV